MLRRRTPFEFKSQQPVLSSGSAMISLLRDKWQLLVSPQEWGKGHQVKRRVRRGIIHQYFTILHHQMLLLCRCSCSVTLTLVLLTMDAPLLSKGLRANPSGSLGTGWNTGQKVHRSLFSQHPEKRCAWVGTGRPVGPRPLLPLLSLLFAFFFVFYDPSLPPFSFEV